MRAYPALICARGGSKGVPGKNIRKLAGKSLIGWAIQAALAVERIDRVIVSTDSAEIAAIAENEGALVPFLRPAELARDDSPEWLVWRHALHYLQQSSGETSEGLVVVPATAPLRSSSDLERCIDLYEKGECDCVVTVTDAHRSPYFNMVVQDMNGQSRLAIPPKNGIFRRQDVPIVFDMTTVCYVVRPDFVFECDGIWDGRVRHVHVPPERALDIDTEMDLRIAEMLMNETPR